jgi:ribosomal protein L7Ae-like RNA K-turn-binding protein
MCTYYKVNIYFYADKEQLGHAIGKQYRASIAVTDANLAKAVEKVLLEEQV